MSFPKYEAYKDSGVEWLGEVPKHWTRVPMKYLAVLNPKKSDYQGDQSKACSFVPMEKLKTGTLSLDEERTISDVYTGYTYFENGDVLQAKVTPCFENKNIAIAENLTNEIGFGSSEINVLRAFESVSNRFLYYRLQESNFMDFCVSSMTGVAGLQRVPSDTINNFSIALPKKDEQTQIAQFLDHETDRIDTLIAEQQRLIELLKEKRQAVISHAVTKGLDPTVPMKDSGVEWLGEVPAHWEAKRFKFLVSDIEGGFSPQCFAYPPNEAEWGVLKSGCVNRGIFNSQESKALPGEVVPPPELEVFQGDILMSRASGSIDLIGSVAMVCDQPKARLLLSDKTFRLKLKLNIVDPDFFVIVMGSPVVRRQIRQCISGAEGLANNISQSNIKELILPFPPKEEQKSIFQILQDQFQVINSLSNTATLTLSLLQERRSALISAAVTGKIDVRNWQVPASV